LTSRDPSGHQLSKSDLAGMIDHTLLKPDATEAQIEKLCTEAVHHGFFSVCVNSSCIEKCKSIFAGTSVKICTVVGFPLGANVTSAKVSEAADAEWLGADEIDMVINIGALKDGRDEYVRNEISSVVDATSRHIVTKVILENCYLIDDEKRRGCRLAMEAGADFVKTSTGFGPSGATVDDVTLMKEEVGKKMGIKAAGGIRDLGTALNLIRAGATRLGTSSSVKIIGEMSGQ
jgi:deoxyribose-phosphate aldolase